ncbi:phage terminase small subunit P27 family [Pseudochelatococcus lubricantis]|uniref:phage terminase small subunit P27 family n=1 Tax=Pseudochelatococcus lubricantis TaxID=1538102 RepID=UPI0035EBE620
MSNNGPALTPPPAAPSWLPKLAKDEWKRLAQLLHENGVLQEDTKQLFASYCLSVSAMREAEAILSREGIVVDGAVNAAFRALNLAQKEFRILSGELGLLPGRRPKQERRDDDDDALGL